MKSPDNVQVPDTFRQLVELDESGPAERIAAMAREFLEQMPAELRRECAALADLSPEDGGTRVVMRPDDDALDIVWMDRHLGTVRLSWVRDGW